MSLLAYSAKVIIPTPITPSMIVSSSAAEPAVGETVYSASEVLAKGEERYLASTHRIYRSLRGDLYPCAITAASPGKVSLQGYLDADGAPKAIPANTPIAFRNVGGALPTGLAANTVYYTKAASATLEVEVAATPGGTSINTTGGTGQQYAILYPNKGNSPDTSPFWWYDERPTNKFAEFDELVDTPTTVSGTHTLVLEPGLITGFACLELVGANLHVEAVAGGETVYEHDFPLTNVLLGDGDAAYMFELIVQLREVSETDLPPYDAEWTFTLTGSGDVARGVIVVGTSYGIGTLITGARTGFSSYSEVRTNTVTGKSEIDRKRRVRAASGILEVEREATYAINRVGDMLNNVLAVYILTPDDARRGQFTVYGLASDFTEVASEYVTSGFSFACRGF